MDQKSLHQNHSHPVVVAMPMQVECDCLIFLFIPLSTSLSIRPLIPEYIVVSDWLQNGDIIKLQHYNLANKWITDHIEQVKWSKGRERAQRLWLKNGNQSIYSILNFGKKT